MKTENKIQTAAVMSILEAKRTRRALEAAAARAKGERTVGSYRALANRIDALLDGRTFSKEEWQVETRVFCNLWELKAMRRALRQAVDYAKGQGTVNAYRMILNHLEAQCGSFA